ncbi:uncharacterized protein LAESUDRAFT_723564 [Laetiporus sulphureus 93-53]|uniref:Uncharacterized protein n=1 Tax=Laetiporus sulphureus 93-53 TaxID=1314785 RepID=A0A165FAB5_9APHY|nr:uncharacterized protein LAESUDRAFT_723564 [Laetiporus sulphureus 93-53]KZT08667.1 hypothetical protein LAESUDRAFT_723564 [Laetiporus sulphureus 93-53]
MAEHVKRMRAGSRFFPSASYHCQASCVISSTGQLQWCRCSLRCRERECDRSDYAVRSSRDSCTNHEHMSHRKCSRVGSAVPAIRSRLKRTSDIKEQCEDFRHYLSAIHYAKFIMTKSPITASDDESNVMLVEQESNMKLWQTWRLITSDANVVVIAMVNANSRRS